MPTASRYKPGRKRLEARIPDWAHRLLTDMQRQSLGVAIDDLLAEHEDWLRRYYHSGALQHPLDTFISDSSYKLLVELHQAYGPKATRSMVLVVLLTHVQQQQRP